MEFVIEVLSVKKHRIIDGMVVVKATINNRLVIWFNAQSDARLYPGKKYCITLTEDETVITKV